MTTAAPAAPPIVETIRPGSRLVRLHLVSRRIPNALLVLVACALCMRGAQHLHWIGGSGSPLEQQRTPLVFEVGVAAVVAVTMRNPFGEGERVAGRWLPYLRLGTAVSLTATAIGTLTVATAGLYLPGGAQAMARNVTGLIGLGLLSAAALGGALAWIGPVAYLAIAEFALGADWQTPWIWSTHTSHDTGAALCAGLSFVAGATLITVRGTHD